MNDAVDNNIYIKKLHHDSTGRCFTVIDILRYSWPKYQAN